MILESPVIAAIEGDQTTVEGKLVAVGRYCACPFVAYRCLSCLVPLANFCQAEIHVLEDPKAQRHTIARDCSTHGLTAL